MSKVAFELRATHEKLSGGSVSLPGGEAFDIGKALADGGGKIVLNPDPKPKKAAADGRPAEFTPDELERAAKDGRIAEALELHPALKHAAAGGGSASTTKQED